MPKKKRWKFTWKSALWIVAAAALLIVGAGILGDYGYARVVRGHWAAWEAGVERHPDGVRKGCRAYTVGDGDTALLLIHGFGDGPPVFGKMAPALADAGYTVRVMRLPGFAEPMSAYARTDLNQWTAVVREELAGLRRRHPRVWVMGHSTGATLGVRQALEEPDSLDGLVLLAPLFGVSDERSPVLRPRTWYTLLNELRIFTWIVENHFEMDVHDKSVIDYPYRDRFVPVTVYDDLYVLLDQVRSRGGELTGPLLMFVAAEDQIVDPGASRAFFEAAASEPKEFVERTDAGHVLPLDQGWDTMVKQADAFIRRSESRRDRSPGSSG